MSDEFGNGMLLRLTLEAAVPLWIARLQSKPWSHVSERAKACLEVIAYERGADVLYKSKRKGDTAKAFNALAEGIACIAFAVGGVKVFGLHFEAVHPEAVDEAERIRWRRAFEEALLAATIE